MEGLSPTMPGVTFLKLLKIKGFRSDNHGKFEYTECKESKNA